MTYSHFPFFSLDGFDFCQSQPSASGACRKKVDVNLSLSCSNFLFFRCCLCLLTICNNFILFFFVQSYILFIWNSNFQIKCDKLFFRKLYYENLTETLSQINSQENGYFRALCCEFVCYIVYNARWIFHNVLSSLAVFFL